jgi:hypothetical protein
LDPSFRRRLAPLLLLAAGLGAYTMMERTLPRDHEVVIDLGGAARDVTDVEVVWTRPGSDTEEAALTTRWHFAPGTAPARIPAHVRLPDGEWEVDVGLQRDATRETTHGPRRVNLEGTPWWKRDNLKEAPVILHVQAPEHRSSIEVGARR